MIKYNFTHYIFLEKIFILGKYINIKCPLRILNAL